MDYTFVNGISLQRASALLFWDWFAGPNISSRSPYARLHREHSQDNECIDDENKLQPLYNHLIHKPLANLHKYQTTQISTYSLITRNRRIVRISTLEILGQETATRHFARAHLVSVGTST
jgi:hypothetical protein